MANYIMHIAILTVLKRHAQAVVENSSFSLVGEEFKTKDNIDLVRLTLHRSGDGEQKRLSQLINAIEEQRIPCDFELTYPPDLFCARLTPKLSYDTTKYTVVDEGVTPPGWANQEQRWCQLQVHQLIKP